MSNKISRVLNQNYLHLINVCEAYIIIKKKKLWITFFLQMREFHEEKNDKCTCSQNNKLVHVY